MMMFRHALVISIDVWLGGVMVGVSQTRPFHCQLTTLAKLFTHMCLCHQPV